MFGEIKSTCVTVGCLAPVPMSGAFCVYCQSLRTAGQQPATLAAHHEQPSKQAVSYHPANDLFNALPPEAKQLVPGERFSLSFYGKRCTFVFEAWNGATLIARPIDQVWATVTIPLGDLARFAAHYGV